MKRFDAVKINADEPEGLVKSGDLGRVLRVMEDGKCAVSFVDDRGQLKKLVVAPQSDFTVMG